MNNKTAHNSSSTKKIESVSEFMQRLDHPLKAEIEALRQIILSANNQIGEEIKWNAPSFFVTEHFATFNLRSTDYVQIIFHRGAKARDNSSAGMEIQDPDGILDWLATDRCVARFYNMNEVTARQASLERIVNQWIQRM